MKRRILLLMMTALLSVGAWAENLWTNAEAIEAGADTKVQFPADLKTSDVIRVTVTITNQYWYHINLYDMTDWWKDDDKLLSSVTIDNNGNLSEAEHIIEIPVTSTIIDAIANSTHYQWLHFYGDGFKMSSVDIARNAGGLTILTSGEASTWGNQKIQSRFISYASVGDVIEVTASRKSNEWGGEVYIKDGADTPNVLGSGWLGDFGSEVPVKISVTTAMLVETNLYLWGGYYDISSVKLIFSPMLANDADNTDAINYWQSISTNVTLAGRTLTKSGDWNTLCLPFAVSAEQLAESTNPLYGATIKELNASSSNLAADGTLTLAFTDASSIEAGKPYIVKWASGENVSNPLFESVTITATTPTAVEFSNAGGDDCKFVGQFSPFTIDAGNKDEIIMLGSGSKLGYSQNARTLKTFRAHFEVPTTSGGAAARAFVMNFGDEETTGIISVQGSGSMVNGSDAWYSLGGQRLQSAPTAKGVYIQNGRKVVVK